MNDRPDSDEHQSAPRSTRGWGVETGLADLVDRLAMGEQELEPASPEDSRQQKLLESLEREQDDLLATVVYEEFLSTLHSFRGGKGSASVAHALSIRDDQSVAEIGARTGMSEPVIVGILRALCETRIAIKGDTGGILQYSITPVDEAD